MISVLHEALLLLLRNRPELVPAAGLDEERADIYADPVMASLKEVSRRALEERMKSGGGYRGPGELRRVLGPEGGAR